MSLARSRLILSSPRSYSTHTPGVTHITTLKNGLRVASEYRDIPTATVGLWIDTGSRYETHENNGVAHFLEHLTFKGTPRRSPSDIELEVETLGAHLNAYTSREQTCYNAKILAKDAAKAIDLLSDIIQNSNLDPQAIENERGVILREMEDVNKNMEEVIMDHLHSVAFQGSPLAKTILGPIKNINALKRQDFVDYIKNNYAAQRMVLASAGGIPHDQLVSLAETAFSSLPATTTVMKPLPGLYTGAEMIHQDDTMENAHIAIALRGCSYTSPDYFPLLLAQAIVGNWDRSMGDGYYMGSKLAQNVSQYQLAHSYMSFTTSYTDTGLWGIYLVSDRKYQLDDLVYFVQQEWVRLCTNVTENELNRAKNNLKNALLLSLDGTCHIAEDIGRQILIYGQRFTIPEMFTMIDQVSVKRLMDVTQEYLYDRCPAVVAIGPTGSMPDYSRIRASTLWLRN